MAVVIEDNKFTSDILHGSNNSHIDKLLQLMTNQDNRIVSIERELKQTNQKMFQECINTIKQLTLMIESVVIKNYKSSDHGEYQVLPVTPNMASPQVKPSIPTSKQTIDFQNSTANNSKSNENPSFQADIRRL